MIATGTEYGPETCHHRGAIRCSTYALLQAHPQGHPQAPVGAAMTARRESASAVARSRRQTARLCILLAGVTALAAAAGCAGGSGGVPWPHGTAAGDAEVPAASVHFRRMCSVPVARHAQRHPHCHAACM